MSFEILIVEISKLQQQKYGFKERINWNKMASCWHAQKWSQQSRNRTSTRDQRMKS